MAVCSSFYPTLIILKRRPIFQYNLAVPYEHSKELRSKTMQKRFVYAYGVNLMYVLKNILDQNF